MVYILLHLVNIISIALGWHLDKGLYFDGVGGTSMNLSFFCMTMMSHFYLNLFGWFLPLYIWIVLLSESILIIDRMDLEPVTDRE